MESYNTTIILLNVPSRRNWWLLFGEPAQRHVPASSPRSESRIEMLTFSPGSVFGVSRQTLNDYGVVEWEVLLLRAVRPGESANLISGVRPGAQLLLATHGKRKARLVQRYLGLFSEFGVDPALTPQLHQRAAPFLQSGVLPQRFVRAALSEGGTDERS